MRFSAAFVALAAPYLISAAPVFTKRAEADIVVLKFADVLEQLESEFYAQALQRFQDDAFVAAGFSNTQVPVEQFTTIQNDEATHSIVLQSALREFGAEPITTCKFNFEGGLTDVATMAATARVVEYVGVAAYLGGAILLTDPSVLIAAGSILTVEARHQTVLNILSGTGTAVPNPFDFAFTPSEVLALASPFIDPSSPCDLGIPANPTLSVTNTDAVVPGTKLEFSSDALNGTQDGFFCQMLTGGAHSTISLPLSECVVPPEVSGPVAIFITSDEQPLLNNPRDRATKQMVAGPTIAFIDVQPEALGQLARGGGVVADNGGANNTPAGESVSTSTSIRTISPDEASSIIASATATDATATATVTGDATIATADPAGTSDSASASATDAAPADPAATGGAAAPDAGNASASTPAAASPNEFTGPSADGAVTVNGWSVVPASN